MDRLNEDVLREIFRSVAKTHADGAFILLTVSTSWQALALQVSMADLWIYITISDQTEDLDARLQISLAFARGRPLAVRFRYSPRIIPALFRVLAYDIASLTVLAHRQSWDSLQETFDLLKGALRTTRERFVPQILWTDIDERLYVRFQRLALGWCDVDRYFPFLPPLVQNDLCGRPFPTVERVPTNLITLVQLRDTDRISSNSADNLYKNLPYLGTMTHLYALSLDYSPPMAQDAPTLYLPGLEILHLEVETSWSDHTFTSKLRVPKLRRFWLRGRFKSTCDIVRTMSDGLVLDELLLEQSRLDGISNTLAIKPTRIPHSVDKLTIVAKVSVKESPNLQLQRLLLPLRHLLQSTKANRLHISLPSCYYGYLYHLKELQEPIHTIKLLKDVGAATDGQASPSTHVGSRASVLCDTFILDRESVGPIEWVPSARKIVVKSFFDPLLIPYEWLSVIQEFEIHTMIPAAVILFGSQSQGDKSHTRQADGTLVTEFYTFTSLSRLVCFSQLAESLLSPLCASPSKRPSPLYCIFPALSEIILWHATGKFARSSDGVIRLLAARLGDMPLLRTIGINWFPEWYPVGPLILKWPASEKSGRLSRTVVQWKGAKGGISL
ncbi:SubName: Full=Uncharacterized protein {ECO:0000313/EMBL:CCA73551.1} [Serendipita indica DSM 11827]|nr:SubName: Full=Uncharacterized protein {ECO:0000313/EMBL:CCA73551.1} [Serendipita indica DSM 11827]